MLKGSPKESFDRPLCEAKLFLILNPQKNSSDGFLEGRKKGKQKNPMIKRNNTTGS